MKDNKQIVVRKYNLSEKEKAKNKLKINIDKKTFMTIAVILIIIAIVFIVVSILDNESLDSNLYHKEHQQEPKAFKNQETKSFDVENKEVKNKDISNDEVNNKVSHLQHYLNLNESTIGYIKIENTNIDYPVVQTDNNEYYINHNFEYDLDKKGAIFMDTRCDIDDFSKTRNIILYGHRMKDGTMFKDLTKYLDKDFFLSNRTFRFDTINEKLEWKVFAVFETTTDFYYIDTEFPYDEMWLHFLDQCHDLSIYKTNMNFYKDDIVLTLSTCTTEQDGRLVVMAKLIQ